MAISLGYAVEAEGVRRGQLPMLLLMTPALVIPLVPFVHSISPLMAATESHWLSRAILGEDMIGLLGCSFFIGPFYMAYSALLLCRTRPFRFLIYAIRMLAVFSWVPIGLFVVAAYSEMVRNLASGDLDFHERETWIFLFAGVFAAGGLMVTLYSIRRDWRTAILLSFGIPFTVNALMCLILFWGDNHQAGYYLTACVVPAFLVDLLFCLPLTVKQKLGISRLFNGKDGQGTFSL